MGKKATFILDQKIMEQSKELKEEIVKIKQEEIKFALLKGSQDPLFLSDLKEIEEHFACADLERAG